MELTRRDMLKLSLLGSAALMLPAERMARTQLKVTNRLPQSKLPLPFRVPFSRPPVARPLRRTATTDYYRMSMKQASVEILPGLKTEVWGYEGITPGPTIMANRGREVVVRHINRISSPRHVHTSVHLHGNASLPQYDGYANDVTRPGEYKDYRYPNNQDARTLWYHDHGVHATAENAYMGCAAFYITHDPLERSLPIPKGRYDVPLVLRDAMFARNGSMIFDPEEHDSLFGDVILANGRPWPRMQVERRKYRFRILNASISRGFDLALSSGEPMTVIGTDGGLMPAPVEVNSMRVGMAERYEVVIDFAKYKVGQKVVLRNLKLPNNVPYENTDVVMRFDVAADAASKANNSVPEVLNPGSHVMHLQESESLRTRRFHFHRKNGMWVVNGKTWDKDRVDANPGLGDTEIWELYNNSGGWFHPVHIHLVDFRILSRNGKPPHPYEVGPKDTAYIGEGEKVRVLMKFGPHKGKYMIHCHNLAHEDHDMMTQFEVGQGGPDPITADPAKPLPAGSLV